jgi:hypothetical protein
MARGDDHIMKREMILLLMFLTSCQIASNDTTSQSIQAFEISEQCPHVCWLGINPGVTSVEDAEAQLQASDQIDHKTIVKSENSIEAIWHTKNTINIYSPIGLAYKGSLVQTIYLTLLSGFKLNDFIVLLGEPDEISIHIEPADNRSIIYTLYYSSSKTMIYSISGGPEGPSPNDSIYILSLNAEFDSSDLPVWRANDYENRQPWLGYGHINDYLPGQVIPTASNGTSNP